MEVSGSGRDLPGPPSRIRFPLALPRNILLEQGIADEILLFIYPVLLGQGKRFLSEGAAPRTLELVDTNALPSGIIVNRYKSPGPLKKNQL